MSKKEITWKYEVGQRIIEYNNDEIIKDITIIDRKIEVEKIKDKRKEKGFTINNIKYYKYRCNLCEFECNEHYKNGEYKEEYWIKESLIKYSNCLYCTGQIVIKGVNDIATTHPYLVKYFVNPDDSHKYSYGSNKKVWFKCSDCEYKKEYKINTVVNYGFSCSSCSDGIKYPNKFAFSLLDQLNIDFKPEYSPEWIKPKSYDFYFELNNKKYIIEMDGGLGHGKGNYKNNMTAEESQAVDDYKDKLANEHDIKVIRIDCDYGSIENRFDYIKENILQDKELYTLLDLSQINWNRANEFACENLIKKVCESWNKKIYSTDDLSILYRLSLMTIIKYLKIGNSMKWCIYDAKIEREKSITKVGKMNGKEIMCIETKQKFESSMECARKSLKVFGIKLTASLINQVCNGHRNHHHGYHFCFV